MNITEIRKLVEIIKENELTEFELDEGEFSIRIRRGGESVQAHGYSGAPFIPAAPMSAPTQAPVAATPAEQPVAEEAGVDFIKSPMVGTFYRAPSPDSDVFVKEGQSVSADSVVCIIEAMKVMNEIQSEMTGTILEALVKDGEAVEFGQPLFKIKS